VGLFSRRDWNIVALTYETADRLRLNGNRKQGKKALAAMKGASIHSGTVCWMVFDQTGKSMEQGLGPAAGRIPKQHAERLLASFPRNPGVLEILRKLEEGRETAAKIFDWQPPESANPNGSD
jgi:hypothetical protein